MTPRPGEWPVHVLPLNTLAPDPATDFALAPVPEALAESIRELGVTTPLIAAPSGDGHRVLCGHRRLSVLRAINAAAAPVRLADPAPDTAGKLLLQLRDNRGHRVFSDIETGRALLRLTTAGLGERALIGTALPLLGHEPAKKRLDDFLGARDFSSALQNTLHALNVPLRVYSILYRWDDADRAAGQHMLQTLKPGVNKCRDLLELIDETASRDALAPADLLGRVPIGEALRNEGASAGDRYQAVHRILFQWRYPNLARLRSDVRRALEQMKLDPCIRLRVPENFESDELKVEFPFQSREEFARRVEQLFRLTDATALDDLLNIFREMK